MPFAMSAATAHPSIREVHPGGGALAPFAAPPQYCELVCPNLPPSNVAGEQGAGGFSFVSCIRHARARAADVLGRRPYGPANFFPGTAPSKSAGAPITHQGFVRLCAA